VFRRRRGGDPENDADDAADDTADATAGAEGAAGDAAADSDEAPPPDRTYGPFDVAEVDLHDEEFTEGRMNLGALLVRGRPGMNVRIEVDKQTERIRAVTLLSGRAGVQLQAFAAPRSSGIWPDLSKEIAADATKRGGTATAMDGPFGAELKVVLPATMPDGRRATQTIRVVGVDGPRWLLRATFFGPAVNRAEAGELDDAFRDTVVVRGTEPMPPREPLPLRMPAEAEIETDDPSETGELMA
jgi:hypothetical protein